MQPTPSKRARFNKPIVPFQTSILSKISTLNKLLSSEDLLKYFPLSTAIFESRSDVLFLLLLNRISHLQL